MSFATNKLPEAFEEEHGTIDLEDDKPGVGSSGSGAGDQDGEDEDLDLARAKQRVWLCKVPRFLLDKWMQQQQEGQILGRVRVFDEKDSTGQPKISVILNEPAQSASPSKPDVKGKRPASATDGVPTEYKLTMQNTNSKNLFVFGEKIEDDLESGEEGARKKRRVTSLLGTVAHECSLTPSIQSADASAAYARILRERQRKASEPRRTLKMLDVDAATANRMASGMGMAGIKGRVATFANTTNKAKASGAAGPRYTRIPKNELLDALFTHFGTAPYWSLRALNDHVQQPQVYLRDCLSEVATLVPKGPYANMWALKPEFKGTQGVRGTAAQGAGEGGAPSTSSARGEAQAGVKQETEAILGTAVTGGGGGRGGGVKQEDAEDPGALDLDDDDDLEMVS
ncbi:hypothetical protein Rhopal_006230-T1 [Rhodotorula paludigena]|uniref:Transcription initiation factor IIF subunit beta n=1 Tax=Rhodotorula paludigena TaxID=86838 RepID=A0AAV5GSH6_9BASI|nr:hypothetical protein Rhopal_006230-T1 [Rhodotorula paludigena]